ncbi:MAG: molybdopterin molybdotransferase MoeA [bacterium]
MISYEEALAAILDQCTRLPAEEVPLEMAQGRFLAEPLFASADLPRFDCSSVDGFGLRLSDAQGASPKNPVTLKIAGVAHAGATVEGDLQPRTCIKLMTGTAVSSGVEAVIMREDVEESDDFVVLRNPARPGENIRLKGGDCRKGEMIAEAGSKLDPPLIALHAAQGLAHAVATCVPRVSLLATGDEVVLPGAPIAAGQIYDSNLAALEAAVQLLGLKLEHAFHCKDDLSEIVEKINGFTDTSQIILSAGGVSAGDRDFVREACMRLGMRIVFHGVAIKPGKPTLFATYRCSDGNTGLFFGLPGNPVAALLSFVKLVCPAIERLTGAIPKSHRRGFARLTGGIARQAQRLEFVRGIAGYSENGIEVRPMAGRDSHLLRGLFQANCLIAFPRERDILQEGEVVEIEWLPWN